MALSLLPQRRKAYMFGTAWRKRYRPNETLSVVAVRVSNPDRSPVGING